LCKQTVTIAQMIKGHSLKHHKKNHFTHYQRT
ncbi:Zn-dependent oxidoreductase, partial [Shigella boydii]